MTYDEMSDKERGALRERVWAHMRRNGDMHANTIAREMKITMENVAGALEAMSKSGGVRFLEENNRWRANPRPK